MNLDLMISELDWLSKVEQGEVPNWPRIFKIQLEVCPSVIRYLKIIQRWRKSMKKKKLSKVKMNAIAKVLAKYEGKKRQVRIGDLREIIRIMYEMDLLVHE